MCVNGNQRLEDELKGNGHTPDVRVGVIGAGYWGKNLIRNLAALNALEIVCDSQQDMRSRIRADYPTVRTVASVDEVFSDATIQACVIATPAETHYALAMAALKAGKDVFVEKPLALRLSEAEALAIEAAAAQRVLMVGHLLRYHPAVETLLRLIAEGELGRIDYAYSNRLNLGKIRREENALWSFAPHDISVLLALFGDMPIQVTAVGGAYLQANVADSTLSTMLFDNGARAHIFVSWLHPYKEQRLVLVGSKRMAVFDDTILDGKLRIFEKNVDLINGDWSVRRDIGEPVPHEEAEPLRVECMHFLHCVTNRKRPRTDASEGIRVLRVLQCCQRSMQMNGEPVSVLATNGELILA
jgi:UDP-2-acetamido-3-amino-2,3-dideoxy-glucuronate N-acetyltransferase